jgi:(p)ppGpp synthase/HD superfamily hydrolase
MTTTAALTAKFDPALVHLGSLAGTFDLAVQIMARAHAGQKDKRGEPYIFHPLAVLNLLERYTISLSPQQVRDAQILAVLHDVIEDSDWTLDDLRAAGFSLPVLVGLDFLTRRKGEAYMVYVRRVADHPLARRVKLADLDHNLSSEREVGDPQEEDRRLRYLRAREILLQRLA